MSDAPSIEDLFLAGGMIFFFDPGSGERDLGFIEEPPDVEPKSTEIKVYSSRSGKRRLAKTFTTEEEVLWNLKLQTPNMANMQAFFKGGPIEVVGAGTGTKTDQLLALSGSRLASLGKYAMSGVTVRQFLDYAFRKEADGTIHDNSAEAELENGSPFDFLTLATDKYYLGKANSQFKEFYSNLAVNGEYAGLVVKYWNGSAWAAVSGLAGAGAGFDADGKVQITEPDDWALTTITGVTPTGAPFTATGKFLEISATTVTTPATVNHIRQNALQNTDYILDPGQVAGGLLVGRIGRLAGGFLADGEEVKVSYTYTTWSALRFAVANDEYQQGRGRIQFRPLRGKQWNYIIPKCQLKPNGKITMDDKKVVEIPMILEVLDGYAIDPDHPFGYWECLNES